MPWAIFPTDPRFRGQGLLGPVPHPAAASSVRSSTTRRSWSPSPAANASMTSPSSNLPFPNFEAAIATRIAYINALAPDRSAAARCGRDKFTAWNLPPQDAGAPWYFQLAAPAGRDMGSVRYE